MTKCTTPVKPGQSVSRPGPIPPSGVRWDFSSKSFSWKLVESLLSLPWWVKTILVLVLLGLIGYWTLDAYLAGRTLQELIQEFIITKLIL